MDSYSAMSVPHNGYDYKYVCRLLFDPNVLLPICAVTYTSDIEAAEKAGATSVAWVMRGIARTKGKTLGLHDRTVQLPLSVARALSFDSYEAYVADRYRKLVAIGIMDECRKLPPDTTVTEEEADEIAERVRARLSTEPQ
jgi:MoxR-like ATPase